MTILGLIFATGLTLLALRYGYTGDNDLAALNALASAPWWASALIHRENQRHQRNQ